MIWLTLALLLAPLLAIVAVVLYDLHVVEPREYRQREKERR